MSSISNEFSAQVESTLSGFALGGVISVAAVSVVLRVLASTSITMRLQTMYAAAIVFAEGAIFNQLMASELLFTVCVTPFGGLSTNVRRVHVARYLFYATSLPPIASIMGKLAGANRSRVRLCLLSLFIATSCIAIASLVDQIFAVWLVVLMLGLSTAVIGGALLISFLHGSLATSSDPLTRKMLMFLG